MGRMFQESRQSTDLLLSIVIGVLITIPAIAADEASEMVGYTAGVMEGCEWYIHVGGNATIGANVTPAYQDLTIQYYLPFGRYNQPTVERVLVGGFQLCLRIIRHYPSLDFCIFAIGDYPDKEIVAVVVVGNSTLNHTA